MLEYMDTIYMKKSRASQTELDMLYTDMEKLNFPNLILPKKYIDLLKESNGGEFTKGERLYQLCSTKDAIEYYKAYIFDKFMPFALPFATDGSCNFYIFDKRSVSEKIYCTSSGNLGWDTDEVYLLAENFEQLLLQDFTIDSIIFV